MKANVKISEAKKIYCVFADEETRGFCASLRRLQKDCTDAAAKRAETDAAAALKAAADEAKKAAKRAADTKREAAKDATKADKAAAAAEEAKAAAAAEAAAKKAADAAHKAAKEAAKRAAANMRAASALEMLSELMQRKNFAAADITKDFLLQYLPQRFNAANELCRVSVVKAEEEAETREKFADMPQILVERESTLYIYKPLSLFTANSFLSLFCAAADARKKEAAENLSAAEKEAKQREAEEREAKRIAAYKAKIAAYEAKIAARNAK